MRLATGTMVLVRPIVQKKRLFLPCTYGYATTIRRAQGATLTHGCIWFNHCYPPERGYGYVAASRFRAKSGIYLYGAIRATDWLPVGGDEPYEDTKRSDLSDDSAYDDTEERLYSRSPMRSGAMTMLLPVAPNPRTIAPRRRSSATMTYLRS